MSEYIYNLVKRLIKKYDTQDPERLIDLLGIKLIYMSDAQKLLGVYTVMLRQPTIIIKQGLEHLKKTVLAHELGHDRLHRNAKSTVAFTDDFTYIPYDGKELEANIFAAHLLIDDDEFLSLYYEKTPFSHMSNIFEVPEELICLKAFELNKIGIIKAEDGILQRPAGNFLSKKHSDSK